LNDLRTLAAVAVGGAAGSVARYLVQYAFVTRLGGGAGFPYATLLINVLGSFVIGIVAELAMSRGLDPLVRTFLMVGILGGFTTFSSFSLEAVSLGRSGEWIPAIIYVAASVVLGIVAAVGGIAATRAVAG
jgi:CrcB protein